MPRSSPQRRSSSIANKAKLKLAADSLPTNLMTLAHSQRIAHELNIQHITIFDFAILCSQFKLSLHLSTCLYRPWMRLKETRGKTMSTSPSTRLLATLKRDEGNSSYMARGHFFLDLHSFVATLFFPFLFQFPWSVSNNIWDSAPALLVLA